MKRLGARILAVAAMGSVLMASGCIYDRGEVVITDKVCVDIPVYETTGTFSTFTVCPQFKDVLEAKLAEYGKGRKDVKSIHMIGGTFKTKHVANHDWRVTGEIDIARQDVANGPYDDGPKPFTHFNHKSLLSFKGQPEEAKLDADGVRLVDRALKALVNNEEPRLVLIVNNESVDPTPSVSDAMDFELDACVKFQFVIDMGKGDNHGHH
jgi:hypothetical protein